MRFEVRAGNGAARLVIPHVRLTEIAWREHAWVAVLAVVVLAGGWLRLSGANWDQGAHLHPDERYIASIANLIHFPASPVTYFDVGKSPLSPYNGTGDHSYSYGTLPLFGTKAVADVLGQGDYDHLYLVGRRLSSLLDCGTIVLVFLITRLLLAGSTPRRRLQGSLLAAGLYAFTVAAVQASHFFTTDVWLVFFGTLTFYLAARALLAHGRADVRALGLVAAVGFCTGLTAACKVSGLFVALPVAIALSGRALAGGAPQGVPRAVLGFARDGVLALVCAYVGFRLVSPYAFAHSSWLDLTLGTDYRTALQTQRDILDGKAVFPPTLQWLLSPKVWGPFRNLVTWQLGLPLGVCAVAGSAVVAVQAARDAVAAVRTRLRLGAEGVVAATLRLMVLGFVLAVFLYVGTRFQHMGRYLLPILPFLAVASACGLVLLVGRWGRAFAALSVAVVVATAAYALAFHAIYTSRTTRLAANDWIAKHVQFGSSIASENWDDTLPVGSGLAVDYRQVIVPVFDADDSTKLRKLYDSLSEAQYYALSSQRAWRTIGRLPDRYPLMVRYYEQLFAGKLGFDQAVSITSEPRLFGVHLDDVGAEEAFSVYDHPPVKIFRHTEYLTFAEFRHALCAPPVPSACG